MPRKSGIGKTGITQKYHQHNYVDVVRNSVPALYEDTDYSVYGSEEDILYNVLGKILKTANDIDTIFDVSAYDTSATRTHFVIRNNKTNVKPYIFEKKILKALGVSFSDYENEADFKSFVSGTLLPAITLNSPSQAFVSGVEGLDSTVSSAPLVHQYLIDTLSWMYFMNTSGPAGGYDPSTGVTDFVVSGLFRGKTYREKEGISDLFEHLWRNREVTTTFTDYLPLDLRGADSTLSAGIYTSGIQHLDRLKTLIGVWYNEADDNSTELDDHLTTFLTLGESAFPRKMVAAGPFSKFLKAISFGFYDMNTVVDDLGDLLSVESCPPQFLQYLSSLIGWKLLTGDVDRWRAQIRHAIHLYKSKGTRRSLEDAITLLFPESGFNPASGIEETWESFIPRQIYYAIATESKVLRDPNYNQASATLIGINNFDSESKDINYRFATDYVLDKLQDATSAISINGTVFSATTWNPEDPSFLFSHRGKFVKVPPWENERFYETTKITREQARELSGILVKSKDQGGLEVTESTASALSNSIMNAAFESTFMSGQNRKWKYYTSAVDTPPNFDDVVGRGDSDSLSLFDSWNSKGSTVISRVNVSSLEYFFDGISYPTDNIMTSMMDVFRQFSPFHVIVRLYLDGQFEDTYLAVDNDDGICIGVVIPTDDDFDQSVAVNYISTGVVASGDVSAGFSAVSYSNTPRTSARRRNLRNNLPAPLYTRNGQSMPISYSFAGTSGLNPAVPGMISREYIPLGYNFSSGQFFSTKGSASAVYDASNGVALSGLVAQHPGQNSWNRKDDRTSNVDIDARFYGIDVSSTFPFRAIFKTDCKASITRDDVHRMRKSIIDRTLRNYERRDETISLGEPIFRNFAFSNKMHRAYYDYVRKFSSSLTTRELYTNTLNFEDRSYLTGGPSFLDHAYGPLFWNGSFLAFDRLSSKNATLLGLESGINSTKISSHPQWAHVASAPWSSDLSYIASGSEPILASDPVITQTSLETYADDLSTWDMGLTNPNYQSLNSFIDYVSVVARANPATTFSHGPFAVYNSVNSSGNSHNGLDSEGTNLFYSRGGSVSLYSDSRHEGEKGKDVLFLRWSLDKGKSLTRNPDFAYAVGDPSSVIFPLSSVSNWGLYDYTSSESWNQGTGRSEGGVSVCSIGVDPVTKNRIIVATVSGEGVWGDSDSVAISQSNIVGVKPGKTYQINYSLKSDNVTCSGVRVIFRNDTKNKLAHYDGKWGDVTASALSASAGFNFFSSGIIEVTPSSVFNEGDAYSITLLPHGPSTGAPNWTTVTNNVSIEQLSITSSGTVRDNFLVPEHDYSLTIRAQEGMQDTTTSVPDMQLGVRVVTDPLPFLKGTDYGDGKKYYFDFDSQNWEVFDGTTGFYGWRFIDLSGFTVENEGPWKTKTLNFNTKNYRSPYSAKDNLFRRLGRKLHDINTPYHIEVCNSNNVEGFIILDEVSVIDDSYRYQMSEFTLEEARSIFSQFDVVNDGKSSRDHIDSSGYYLTSGGSRDYYVEASSAGTNTSSILGEVSGVIFEFSDD